MIIFDTSVLFGLHPKNPRFDLLMALKHAGTEPAGIPWMVREELVAQQVLEYSVAYNRARDAVNALNRRTPWGSPVDLAPTEVDQAREHWRGVYAEVLHTLETSGESALEALAREAYCQSPAKNDPDAKGGARDAAIWLSVIDYLRSHLDEHVYFVSSNVTDFGDGSSYPAVMLRDLGDMKDRLTLITSFNDVITRFTEKIEIDPGHVKGLLAGLSGDALAPVEGSALNTMRKGVFEGTRFKESAAFEVCWWGRWATAPNAVLRSVEKVSGHKINGTEWYTAAVEWILVGYAHPSLSRHIPSLAAFDSTTYTDDIPELILVACTVKDKVLFSPGAEELTIVEQGAPVALDPSDRADLLPLIDQATEAQEERMSVFIRALASIDSDLANLPG